MKRQVKKVVKRGMIMNVEVLLVVGITCFWIGGILTGIDIGEETMMEQAIEHNAAYYDKAGDFKWLVNKKGE